MGLQKLMTNNAEYNAWANQQFVNWLSAKPDELLYKEVPSSYSSIIKTLNHIWSSQEYWWGMIAQTTDIDNRFDAKTFISAEIFDSIICNSQKLADFIKSLSEEELVKNIKVVNQWFECDQPRYDYLQHIINHGTYHRGQIVTIGRNIGITDAPMTDYHFYTTNIKPK